MRHISAPSAASCSNPFLTASVSVIAGKIQQKEAKQAKDWAAGLLIGIVYAKLILITGMHRMLCACLEQDPAEAFSVLKLAELFQAMLHRSFCGPIRGEAMIKQMRYHARYERRSRPNFAQYAHA